MEQGINITPAMFTFVAFVIASIAGLIGWAFTFVKNKVLRDNLIDTEIAGLKAKSKSKSKKILLIEAELKAIPAQANEIKNVKIKQDKLEGEIKEIKTEIKEVHRVVVSYEVMINGINMSILNIKTANEKIIDKLEKLSDKTF